MFREVFLMVMVLCYRRMPRSVFADSAMPFGSSLCRCLEGRSNILMAEAPTSYNPFPDATSHSLSVLFIP
jgi:hypothetical protein